MLCWVGSHLIFLKGTNNQTNTLCQWPIDNPYTLKCYHNVEVQCLEISHEISVSICKLQTEIVLNTVKLKKRYWRRQKTSLTPLLGSIRPRGRRLTKAPMRLNLLSYTGELAQHSSWQAISSEKLQRVDRLILSLETWFTVIRNTVHGRLLMIEMETLILQLLIWFYQVFCEFRVNVYLYYTWWCIIIIIVLWKIGKEKQMNRRIGLSERKGGFGWKHKG